MSTPPGARPAEPGGRRSGESGESGGAWASWRHRVDDVADLLWWHCSALPARLGSTRLVCLDGPAGSGKTTLARALRRAARDHTPGLRVRTVHLDDLYEDWGGLADVGPRLARDLIAPLREDRAGGYHRYDWHRHAFGDWVEVPPADVVVLEGCGAGDSSYAEVTSCLVWVEAPRALRVARGVARDGEQVLEHWYGWMADEQTVFARERTRERADVLVDGSGEADAAVVFA